MSRTYNGSWGQLTINITDEEDIGSLLVFDEDITSDNYLEYNLTAEVDWAQYVTGMVYDDAGWLPKTIFIANRNENSPAFFTYRYNSS